MKGVELPDVVTDPPPERLPAAFKHGDITKTELWPVPDDTDADDKEHPGDLGIPQRQSEVVGLFGAVYTDTVPSPNYSGRGGRQIRLIALHTAETGDANGDHGSANNIARYFAQVSAQSSAHACSDSDRLIRGVPCAYAAWTMRSANAISVNLEMATRAKRTRAQWLADPGMLEVAAQWVAGESLEHGIPIVHLNARQINDGVSKGVVEHVDWTNATGDGTHWDCGSGFPIDEVLARARQIANNDPTPATDWFDDVATRQDLVDVLRSEGISGAADAAKVAAIVTKVVTAVLRSEGVSGAGDVEKFTGAITVALAAALGK